MHLAVDCRSVHPRMGGIGRAALDLVGALGTGSRGHRITMIVGANHVGEIRMPGVHILPVEGAMIDERFDQFHLPAILAEQAPDVYLNTTFSVPAIKTTRVQASIIHDIVFEDRPDYVEPRLRDHLSRWSRFAAAEADHVLTVSDHALNRIREVYGVPSTRITRVYNGISRDCFTPPTDIDFRRVRERYALPESFILYLGTIEAKKGIVELVSAYERSGLPEPLILAGGKGAPSAAVDAKLRASGVRTLGFVEESDKKALLASCRLFVYPSHYEGFGLPPLEAMALGIPTLVSNLTSLPEIVGDAALVTLVQDPQVFGDALRRGLHDDVLRQRALVAGPARARAFSWEQSADQVLDLFERLGGN